MIGRNKATKNEVIGKLGVGLKDDLGILNNNGVEVVVIMDKYFVTIQHLT